MSSQIVRSAFRHTHRIEMSIGDYRDSALVTPPAGVDVAAWARDHIKATRGDGGVWGSWSVTITKIAR